MHFKKRFSIDCLTMKSMYEIPSTLSKLLGGLLSSALSSCIYYVRCTDQSKFALELTSESPNSFSQILSGPETSYLQVESNGISTTRAVSTWYKHWHLLDAKLSLFARRWLLWERRTMHRYSLQILFASSAKKRYPQRVLWNELSE